MHDKYLVHETTTLSILVSNVDFESHVKIDPPRPTTTPQAPSFSTFSALISFTNIPAGLGPQQGFDIIGR